ncbi:MAG: DUF2974 domain-containing protein [Xenococcaceae cyanobacterium MO_207.B15]|nr:DUF2974 domain-containing protein [Xenococcaceae cyanobacterium MO_207.B15]
MTNFIQSTYGSISRERSTKQVANAVWEFLERPKIKNVLAILDFCDFKTFEIYLPGSKSPRVRRINDDFLKRALRSYNDMSNIANGLDYLIEKSEDSLKALKDSKIHISETIPQGCDVETKIGSKEVIRDLEDKRNQIIQNIDRFQIKRFHESFTDEVVVRGWFVDFLDGLARFENWIESGLTTADELKPFLIHWIEMIADRDKRRKRGSSFYDSLFLFIHEAGYKEVISLFKRYKYNIPEPTYSEVIIDESCLDTQTPTKSDKNQADEDEFHIKRASLLSRAAQLCYEDEQYIRDWVFQWIRSSIYTNQENDDPIINTVFKEVIDFLQKEKESLDILEGKKPYEELSIEFFDHNETNTFAVAFTLPLEDQKRVTIVAFRGSVNIQNWITNVQTRLKSLSEDSDKKDRSAYKQPGKKVEVHRGFLKSWRKIKDQVFEFVDKEDPDSIFLTGHSLGGAIAVIAAVDFSTKYKDKLRGVYTFGQPRVGNWAFAKYFKEKLEVPMFRFVNNSDFVPRIPTLLGKFKYARNIGKWYYFSAFGTLLSEDDNKLWFVLVRDRIIGSYQFLINFVSGQNIRENILISNHDISMYVRLTKENLDNIESEVK